MPEPSAQKRFRRPTRRNEPDNPAATTASPCNPVRALLRSAAAPVANRLIPPSGHAIWIPQRRCGTNRCFVRKSHSRATNSGSGCHNPRNYITLLLQYIFIKDLQPGFSLVKFAIYPHSITLGLKDCFQYVNKTAQNSRRRICPFCDLCPGSICSEFRTNCRTDWRLHPTTDH